MLDDAIRNGKIRGFKINKDCPVVILCLFVNDTNLFGQANQLEANRLNIILEQCIYCAIHT